MMAGTSMRLKASTRERAVRFWGESGIVFVGIRLDWKSWIRAALATRSDSWLELKMVVGVKFARTE